MSNINQNISSTNIDLTNILDQDGFYEPNSAKDGSKITNKSFSPSANFKDIKDDKKYYKQLNTNSNTNNDYNFPNIYSTTNNGNGTGSGTSAIPQSTNGKTKIDNKSSKIADYTILTTLLEEIDNVQVNEDLLSLQNIINQINETNVN